ncbi:hypothetical protein JYU34_005293 [Plutella xylostella]|uniref:Uncharacterized protein n=1 Tax=Plutella xylostella TaxID=51655 RepID=A0ABQ7QWB9_PLUXY|nr:hypothetical protein JYU34_005293 [Plutella xylostella]
MRAVLIVLASVSLVWGLPRPQRGIRQRCVNMWDEGCINGQLTGAGNDDSYLNGGFNPGKRCVNMWDEGCINSQLAGSGSDDSYLNGGFNPGKRCVNMWDEGCINSQLAGSGADDGYLNGGFNPGKRSLKQLAAKLQKMHKSFGKTHSM